MKLIRIVSDDIQYRPKTKQQAEAVFKHVRQLYIKFDNHLRQMSELVHLIKGADREARQELSKKMVGMSDSMSAVWKGIVNEFEKL